jgi:hypothetical protein
MPLMLTVRFTSAGAADASIHRVRNFAEDLHRAVTRDGIGHVENMDSAVTPPIFIFTPPTDRFGEDRCAKLRVVSGTA